MKRPSERPLKVIVVTGMNGAGKTTALKALEDMGYEAVDNLPLTLLPRLLSTAQDNPEQQEDRPLAIGVDSRTRAFRPETVLNQIEALRRRPNIEVILLFLDCADATLQKRFSETRRRHPMALDRPVQDGISREREMMAPVRHAADFVYDTTDQTVHDLKRRLTARYRLDLDQPMMVTAMSFAFARGVPRDADLVFDVRFLRNPNYDPDLKPLTGRDERVAAYVAEDDNFSPFFDRLSDMVRFLLPLYRQEGKSYLTIACGCTGGKHRSVFIAELLGRVLEEVGYHANIIHRDADRGAPTDD